MANTPQIRALYREETETSLISIVLTNRESRLKVFDKIKASDFYNERNKIAYEASLQEFEQFGDIDITKLCDYGLTASEVAKYGGHMSYNSDWVFLDRYIDELKELSRKRELFKAAQSIIYNSVKEDAGQLMEKAMQSLTSISRDSQKENSDALSIFKSIEERWEKTKGKKLIGIDTGIDKLNWSTNGYQEGHFWLIAGYTSYGKSTLAAYMMAKLVKENVPLAVFSTEMSPGQTLEKLITQYCGKELYQIRNNSELYKHQLEHIKNAPLRINSSIRSVEGIRLELMSLKMQGACPPVIFIDFVQNLESYEGTEYEKMTAIAVKLQALALEFQICILGLSQVSNEGAANKSEVIPVKGSGALAAAADMVLQIYRNKKDEKEEDEYVEFEVQIRKNRHGRAGSKLKLHLHQESGLLFEKVPEQKGATLKETKDIFGIE